MDKIEYLPLSALRESPFNPRKAFSEAGLAELADSIRQQGVLQPITVRPLAQADIEHRYEIVFGHRRFRAASLAQPELNIPAIVRELDDEQAAILQVHENLQREDVTALEEADSLARLHKAHGMTADTMSTALGKSRSYVYGRLKLATACADVRAAVLEQGLSPEIALEIARLRTEGQQKAALKRCRSFNDDWLSFRMARVTIRNMFTLRVGAAPFDAEDPLLDVDAGPCSRCPKRACNDPALQELPADVCTDEVCWGAKAAESMRRQVARLQALGAQVLEGDEAAAFLQQAYMRHTDATTVSFMLPPNETPDMHPAEDLADDGEDLNLRAVLARLRALGVAVIEPQPVHAVDAHANVVRTWYRDEEVRAVHTAWAHRVLGQAPRAPGQPSSAQVDDDDAPEAWTEAEELVRDPDAWARVSKVAMRSLLGRPRTHDDLRLVIDSLLTYTDLSEFRTAMDVLGYAVELDKAEQAWVADPAQPEPFSQAAWWDARLQAMGADELGTLLVAISLDDMISTGGWVPRAAAAKRVATVQRLGVDPLAAAQAEEPAQAQAAAPALATPHKHGKQAASVKRTPVQQSLAEEDEQAEA